ncbi:MAG: beta strand repeat-containing protein, partial [Paludibacter sp.]
MKPKKIFFAAIFVFLIVGVENLSGATKTWDGSSSNNWNTANNWTPSGVPGSGDDVVIDINANILVNTNSTINSLTINNNAIVSFTSSGGKRTITIDNTGNSIAVGSSLTLKGSTGSGTRSMNLIFTGTNNTMTIAGTLILTAVGEGTIYTATNSLTTVTGSIINDGTGGGTIGVINSTTANLSFSSGGTYQHALNGGNIPTATWDAASMCNITGMVATSPTGINQTFGNFTWNCSSQTGTVSSTGNIVVNGNFSLTAGTFNLNNGTNNTLTIFGNYAQNGGVFDFNAGTSGNSLVYLNGNFSNTAGAGSITTNGNGAPNGIFTFNRAGTQTFNMPTSGAAIWTMYTINSGSTVQLLSNFDLYGSNSATFYGQVTVNGILNVGTYTISDVSGVSGGSVFTLNTGATLITANSGGIDGSISATNMTRTFSTGANYTFNGSSAQVTGNSLTQNIPANLTINSTNTVSLSAATTISGNLLISQGTFSTSGSNYNIFLDGNWTNSGGTFTAGSGTVTFNGSSAQSINGSTSTTFNNLVINNSGGANLGIDIDVSGTLTLASGRLTLGANNLTVATITGTFNSSNMVVATSTGELRKLVTGNGSYLFPVGDANGTVEYSPITVNFASGMYAGGAYVGIKVSNTKHTNNGSFTNYLNRYWTISSSGLTSFNAAVTATYVSGDVVGSRDYMVFSKYTSSLPWTKYVTLNQTNFNAIANGVTSFTPSCAFTGISVLSPTVSISANPSFSVGQNDALTLTANPVGDCTPFTYLWSPGGATTASISPSTATEGTFNYSVTVTDANGFTGTTNADITVSKIKVSPTKLSGFSYAYGAGPSGSQSFTVSASGLTQPLVINALANF